MGLSSFLSHVVLTLLTASAFAGTLRNFELEHVPDQMIVKFNQRFKGSPTIYLQTIGAKELRRFASGAILIELPAAKEPQAAINLATYLATRDFVQYVEANTIMHIVGKVPNDPSFRDAYGLHNDGAGGGLADADIDAPEAWDLTTGSRNVVVGVVDTGIDYNHSDLKDNMWINPGESGLDGSGRDKRTNAIDDDGNELVDDWHGWDFLNNDNDAIDDHNHGTHCAGIIGAKGNNGVGAVGVNWNVALVPLKFLSDQGSGALSDAVLAIEYATRMGFFLTSNSWGGGGYSDTMAAAIAAANSAGTLFVAAAGNDKTDNDSEPHFPSSYELPNVLAVAATDSTDHIAQFSNFGRDSVHLAAPGVQIISSTIGNTYKFFSGTSMATPFVAGVAALVKASHPQLSALQIKERILRGTDGVAALEKLTRTGGRLNAYNALEDDDTPPSPIRDLALFSLGINSLRVRWSPAGDDGLEGKASRYLVRVATYPMVNQAEWESATPVEIESTDEDNVYLLKNLPLNFVGYVGVRAVDNVGNVGAIGASLQVAVYPVQVLAANPAEAMTGVIADAPWGLEVREGDNHAFSDSPGGNYADSKNLALMLPEYTLDADELMLVFDAFYDLESTYDYAYVEFATMDDTWQRLWRVTGRSGGWKQVILDLKPYVKPGKPFRIRFRLQSDYSVVRDGIKVDDVKILGATHPIIRKKR